MYIGYRNLESIDISECAFADDIALITGSEKDLNHNIEVWNEVLNTNEKKSQIAK